MVWRDTTREPSAGAGERVNMEPLKRGILVHLMKGNVVIIVAVLFILTIGYF
jgi:hypothetical protein